MASRKPRVEGIIKSLAISTQKLCKIEDVTTKFLYAGLRMN